MVRETRNPVDFIMQDEHHYPGPHRASPFFVGVLVEHGFLFSRPNVNMNNSSGNVKSFVSG